MSISPIDSSLYLGLVDSITTFPTKGSLNSTVPAAYTQSSDFDTQADLSGYYTDPEIADLFTEVSNNLENSAKALNDVMISALENGFGVQGAININLALRAYQANSYIAKSVFDLKI